MQIDRTDDLRLDMESSKDKAIAHLRNTPLRGEATLIAVIELQDEIQRLSKKIEEMAERPEPKRSFFG